MYRTMLTYVGSAVIWIYVYLGTVTGHGHHDHDYMYEPNFRDYHYDQYRFDHGRRHPPPPPPPNGNWEAHRNERPPPPPPPPRRERPPPPPPPPRDDNLPILYMENHCRIHIRKYVLDDARVYVDDSMHVKLTKEPSLQREFSCLVTFSTRDPDYGLLLHFEQVDINYNPGTIDRFRIYDGINANRELTPARGLYGKYSKGNYEFSSGSIHDYKSTGQALTLYFIGSPSEVFGGFELLLTVFKNQTNDGRCDPGYLKCEVNRYCISESLYCNGAQNCGQNDFSDSRVCSHDRNRNHDHDPNAMLHGATDIGLMVGCALSIVILMVVIIWLGVICLKKKGFDRMRRHYARQEDSSDGAAAPDGTIVEPAQIHRVMSPPVTFMEPPPLYSENDNLHYGSEEGSYPSGRFELPPPYSPTDDRDTAGLILNQPDRNSSSAPTYSESRAGVHQGTDQTRAPTPPIRTSSIPSHASYPEERLRLRHPSSGAQGAFQPLTGITRQQSKDDQIDSPSTPKVSQREDSGFSSMNSLNGPSASAAAATQTADTQANCGGNSESIQGYQLDNEYNQSVDKTVSVA